MTHFRDQFESLSPEEKLKFTYQSQIKALLNAWKLHGLSLEFNRELQQILFDKDGMPIFIDDGLALSTVMVKGLFAAYWKYGDLSL